MFASSTQRLGVPFEFVEEPADAPLEDRMLGAAAVVERVLHIGDGKIEGMLGMPSSPKVMRNCIAARTPPKAPAEQHTMAEGRKKYSSRNDRAGSSASAGGRDCIRR